MTIAELTSLSRARRYSEPRALTLWLATKFGTTSLTKAATILFMPGSIFVMLWINCIALALQGSLDNFLLLFFKLK